MAMAAALESQAKALAILSVHGQRLSRQFEKTAAQLRELQKTRHAREQEELTDLLDIMEMHEAKRELYRPAADGFVFSQTQIDTAMRARHRQRLAEKAYNYRHAA
jgi:hypothetical protein